MTKVVQKVLSWFGVSKEDSDVSFYEEAAHSYFQTYRIENLLPYELYDEENGIFVSETHVGFILELSPIMGASESLEKDLEFLANEVFEEGSHIQTILWADPDISHILKEWKNARPEKGMLHKLAEKRTAYFEELKTKGNVVPPRNFRGFLSYSIQADPNNPIQNKLLSGVREQVVKTLERSTFVRLWSWDDVNAMTKGSMVYPKDVQEKVRKRARVKVNENEVIFNSKTALRTYSVESFPTYWNLEAMGNLIGDGLNEYARMKVPFYIHYGFWIPPQQKRQEKFHTRMMVIDHQSKSPYLMRINPGFSEEVQDYNTTREALAKGGRIIESHFNVGLFAPKESIVQAEQVLLSIFRSSRWRLEANTHTHLSHHLSSLPLSWHPEHIKGFKEKGLMTKTGLSSEFSALMPIQGEWRGTHSPGMLLTGRRGQLLKWSAFDNDSGNYNTIVVGRSGSGKSVFMQELLVSTLGCGGRVFVIDVGRSFERTCRILSGQFIEFTKKEDICLNPFSNIGLSEDDDLEDTFSMLKSVVAMMAAPTQKTDDYENALIEKALREAWENKKQKATMTDVSNILRKNKDDRAKRLGVMLGPYTKEGVYGRYFEGENNINFFKPMVTIELEELKERKDLQSVVLQIFIMTISNQMLMGDRKTPFHICFDEAWDLLRGEQTGVFIETLARRLRKYRGSLVVGTQSVNDFYKTPGALATFENSDWMCLLSQKKESVEALKNSGRLSMSGAMESALKSVTTRHGEWSEVMIYNSSYGYSIGRLMLDPFSVLLYSTQAHEYAQIQQLVDEGRSIEEAIELMIEIRKEKEHA